MHTNTYLGQRQRKMVHTIKNTDLLIYNTLNKMKKLELIDINKSYDTNVPVLKNVSFSVENGEFLVLLGPSGCGKSTILSIIAGFEKQNDGSVIIDGRNCDTVSCQNRDIAMVFQNYALYPNMNVYNNIAFPLVNRREKKEVIKEKVNILVSGNLDSGILETDIPEDGNSLIGLFTTYQVVRYCQAQSRFAVL